MVKLQHVKFLSSVC